VRAHVPAIGLERHRAADLAHDDLADHHEEREHDHGEGPALAHAVEVVVLLVVDVCRQIMPAHETSAV
jgi:hypothetical protein